MNRKAYMGKVSLVIGILLGVGIVGACKKGKETDLLPGNFSSGVHFAYPYNGQNDVPVGSQIVVKFAQAPQDSQISGNVTSEQFNLVDGSGASIQTVMTRRPGNDSIVEFKTDGLVAGKTYGIRTDGSGLTPGSGSDVLSFTVRKKDVLPGVAPSVVSRNPGAGYPFMDFSTLRILFTENLEVATVTKGGSFKFLDASGAQVPGTLLMRGRYLTFDPASDLRTGEKYTAVLSTDIKDKTGEALDKSYVYEIIPASPGKKVSQVLKLAPDYESGSGTQLSTLVGSNVNTITLTSHLLEKDTTQVKATLFAEMGDATIFPKSLPFVIRKGNFLTSSSVEFKLGAAIKANINTGELHMALASDATGYIVGNPYSDDSTAPAYVVMMMDIAVTAKDPMANSAMTQDIMHVETVGAVTVEGEKLVINVVGAIEMDLLGLEKATGNLVLRLETPLTAPAPEADAVAPGVLTVFPESGDATFGRGGVPIVNFSEPLDVNSVVAGENIQLIDTSDDSSVDFNMEIRGASVLLAPKSLLANNRTYRIQVGESIRDIAGNTVGQSYTSDFTTMFVSTDSPIPALMTSVYPGTPCALQDSSWKSGGNKAGRCIGGEAGDDNFDVFTLPANRPVVALFSQAMDPDTLTLSTDACAKDGSVSVQELDTDGTCVATVPGTLLKKDRQVKFLPHSDWTVGKRYVIIFHSGDNNSCDAGEICSALSVPLNTDPLSYTAVDHGTFNHDTHDPMAGGADIEIPFDVTEETTDVLANLYASPYTDTNNNGLVDTGETRREGNRAGVEIDATAYSGIVKNADVIGEQGLFLSKTLITSIGKYDAENDRIPVAIYPQLIMGTNLHIESDAVALGIVTLNDIPSPTQQQIMRIRGTPTGYITNGPSGPEFSVQLNLYFDAPYLVVQGDLLGIPLHVSQDVQSKEITVDLKGPVTFKDDGRMVITLASQADVLVSINISTTVIGITLNGGLGLKIPKGAMKLNVIGDAPKTLFKDARF